MRKGNLHERMSLFDQFDFAFCHDRQSIGTKVHGLQTDAFILLGLLLGNREGLVLACVIYNDNFIIIDQATNDPVDIGDGLVQIALLIIRRDHDC